MREQVASLRRHEQQGEAPRGGQPPSHPSVLQTALVRLLAFEDSLATAAGQLNVCRQSRQGLQENQRLINRHIASFDASDGGLRPQGQPSAHNHSHQHSHAYAAPCGGSVDSTEAAINGSSGDADHPPTSVVRPASSPAEGDGCGDHNRRRVRARTDQVSPHTLLDRIQLRPFLPELPSQNSVLSTPQPSRARARVFRRGTDFFMWSALVEAYRICDSESCALKSCSLHRPHS